MTDVVPPVTTGVLPAVDSQTKKTYLNPYWSNKENRHLIVTIRFPNGKESMSSIQDKDGTNPDMKAVLEEFSEEEIDENTRKGIQQRDENVKKQVERKESHMLRVKQESLFAAKLEAFEIDTIKKSSNTKIKRLIRKSKSIMEVQAYCSILLMQEIENEENEK